MDAYRDSFEHIRDEMLRVDILLRRALAIARSSSDPAHAEYKGVVISEEEIDEVLRGEDFLSDYWRREAAGQPDLQQFDKALSDLRSRIDERRNATQQAGTRLTLSHLAQQFGLSEAEVDLVLIALAGELEPRYELLFAYLQDDVTRKRPSVNLALNLICRSEREKLFARRMLSPGAPLIHFQILHLEDEPQDRQPLFVRKFLKLPDSVVRFLLDEPSAAVDSAAISATQQESAQREISSESRHALEAAIESVLRSGLAQAVIHLRGEDRPSLDAAVEIVAGALNRGVLRLELGQAEADPTLVISSMRDAAVFDALLAVSGPSSGIGAKAEPLLWTELARVQDPVVLMGGANAFVGPPSGSNLRIWPVTIDPPEFALRRDAWRDTLAAAGATGDADVLADLFRFGPARIRQSVNLGFSYAALRDPSDPKPQQNDFVVAARSLSAANLGKYALQVTPKCGFDDIVLPAERKAQLQSIVKRVRFRRRVLDEWGFAEKLSRGKGNSALFSGPPGTGKTMAAEAIAKELGLTLLQIDLSAVVSKYIGETEGNLAVIFREAENSQTLLFFDEADSLFGKRTEVKDAHDRYANLEVNYLLQRIEQYEGLVILATNFQKNIDEAFLRRIQDVVDFPIPDENQRKLIWEKHFPRSAPVDPDLDLAFLAKQFKLTGGSIKNIVLAAAYDAAEENWPIAMRHLTTALRGEVLKQGKIVMKTDLGRYFDVAVARAKGNELQ